MRRAVTAAPFVLLDHAALVRNRSAASIVTRRRWGAARRRGPYTWRGALRAVVIHHTQVPADPILGGTTDAEAEYTRAVQRSHFERGFVDLGYHFLVMPSGRIFLGRPVWALGAHVAGHNTGTVSISVAGDFDVEQPTAQSLEALAVVRSSLIRGGAGVPLVAHGDLADRRCPGRFLRTRMGMC